MTNSEVYAADQLFATLDPTLRHLELPVVGKVVFADTVGFIRHLPHELVAAFKSTLEESAKADLLLHIVDAADPRLEDNIKAVNAVLKQINADKVKTLLVYNKSDLIADSKIGVIYDDEGKPCRVNISAKTKAGLDELLSSISQLLAYNLCEFTVHISHQDGKLRALLYQYKAVFSESYDENGCQILSVKIREQDAAQIDKLTANRLSECCSLQDKP